MPFSADFDTKLWFDRAFLQRSVRLDTDKLETQCARWLGHPLEQPLRFALRPFSNDLEEIWRRTLSYLWCSGERVLPLGPAAKSAFDEYLLTLLLHHHPHNYSDELAGERRRPFQASCGARSVSWPTTPTRPSPYRTWPPIWA